MAIASDTAFFGAPIEAYLEDRHVFEDAFYSYYIDYEPDHAWVACVGSQVVGFLTGCINTKNHDQVFQRKILPGVIWKFLRGKYHFGKKTWRYSLATLLAALRNEFPNADLKQYPAHLHINLLPEARGKGLGRSLLDHYLKQLNDLSIAGVHLHTTSLNIAACRLYEAAGFKIIAEQPTKMYAHLIHTPVSNRCYGKRL